MTNKTGSLPREEQKKAGGPEDKFWAKRVLDEFGIKVLPPEHWIYREGASVTFVRPRPREDEPEEWGGGDGEGCMGQSAASELVEPS